MKHELPKLPFDMNALAPHISRETLEYHYGKHHQAYVDKLNQLIPGTTWENKSLEDIVRGTFQKEMKVFNQAAQVWNHTFYWNSLTPAQKAAPLSDDSLKKAIERDFGSFEKLKELFNAAAAGQFGSGWAWLVSDASGKLRIETTSNAETPLAKNEHPLLTCDVWEHAYYIDYRNARAKYLESVWPILNWDFAAKNYARRGKEAAA